MAKPWSKEELEILDHDWGSVSIPCISQKLDKSLNAVKLKAKRLGYTRHLHSGEYITFNQLMMALGRGKAYTYALISWVEARGLPIKKKKSINRSYRVIYLEDFWKWAKENRTFIDFSKFEEGTLGKEPEWIKDQRKADFLFAQYKKTPWTPDEDSLLKSMLNSYKYSYRDISIRLKRTEGGIKRRMLDLKIKQRPLKADNHNPWTDEETKVLLEYLEKGYKAEVIAEVINRSALAIKGKIERLGGERRCLDAEYVARQQGI